ncbi:MAG: hypothetical protein BWX84_00568 [Verrucomicrobia bacterium ADurb.Bin118]|jgi:hypothetical protein|nr:MAG: hypothetical protein BWX84_00568 [Verrucomicrobia bacterium ADurb.Bin118]
MRIAINELKNESADAADCSDLFRDLIGMNRRKLWTKGLRR